LPFIAVYQGAKSYEISFAFAPIAGGSNLLSIHEIFLDGGVIESNLGL
jgi:hypothetical protein